MRSRSVYKLLIVGFVCVLAYVFIALGPFFKGKQAKIAEAAVASSSIENTQAAPTSSSASHETEVKQPKLAQDGPKLPSVTAEEVLSVREDDIVFGDPNAEVLLFDYSSITCTHCSEYMQNIFPQIREEFITTNKIGYIKRLIPSNGPALKASLVIRCIPQKQKRYRFIQTLMLHQSEWMYDKFNEYIARLKRYASMADLKEEEFERCVSDDEEGLKIYNRLVRDARAINLMHSPSLYVNGELYQGSYEYDDLKDFIESFMN